MKCILLQVRVWARSDMFNQTKYPLELAAKAYAFYTDYFQTGEVVSKAGSFIFTAKLL